MEVAQKPIAVSMGEPAGIGLDLILIAWNHRIKLKLPTFYVRGDSSVLSARALKLGIDTEIRETSIAEVPSLFSTALPVIQTGGSIIDTPGHEQSETAKSVIESISTSVTDIRNGNSRALVTCPINKAALYQAGFSFPGHTEFLAALAQDMWSVPRIQPVMMIAGPELKVVPVTVHIPVKDIHAQLSIELITEIGEITARDMVSKFGYSSPRIAICGLNPHAGENGSIGHEDADVIAPAIEKLRAKGFRVTGPHPADTLFHPPARKNYDCVLGMYHDQVLVPAKTIGFDDSVNVTLGLPFVRTSPDHGTAYSLAGQGTASINSFVESLRLADQMTQSQK